MTSMNRTTAEADRPSPRSRRLALWAPLCALLLGAALPSTAGAATGVAWDLRSEANTTMAPGTTTRVSAWVRNAGSQSSDGRQVTFRMALPAGLRVAAVLVVDNDWRCTGTPGSSLVTCTTNVVKARDPFGAHGVPTLVVDVQADADPQVSTGLRTIELTAAGGGAATVAAAVGTIRVSAEPPSFGIQAFDGGVFHDDGSAFTQAGGHPDAISTWIDLNRGDDPVWGAFWPAEPVKDIVVDLPPGLVGDPTGERCTAGEVANSNQFEERPLCPPGSQVGTALLVVSRGGGLFAEAMGPVAVYNMVPPAGVPARFGFNISGTVVTLNARLRSEDDYGLSIEARYNPEALAIAGTAITFWGRPADASHTSQRACPGQPQPYVGGPTCPSTANDVPFLRNPTSCVAPAGHPVQDGLVTRIHTDSWTDPGTFDANGAPNLADPAWVTDQFVSHLPPGYPRDPDPDAGTPWGANQLPTGCATVPFAPALKGQPLKPAAVSSPTAFAFDVGLPQSDDPTRVGTADLKKAVVTLPRACGLAVLGLRARRLQQRADRAQTTADPSCPDAVEARRP